MTTALVKRTGLFGGPLLGLLCYYLRPSRYATGPGEWVECTQVGRATLALMVWMAGWWLTEVVDIEATALLPIVTFPLLGIAPRNKVLPPLLLLLAITTMTVCLSALTSNMAQVATMVPVLAAMSPALGMHPSVLIVACTLGASSAYIMPVGTPPKAIVCGTGLVRLPQMMQAGFWLNLAGILLITALATLCITPVLGNEGWRK